MIARVFATIETLQRRPNVRMVSLGSSDTNLSLVVEADAFEAVLEALHAELFVSAARSEQRDADR